MIRIYVPKYDKIVDKRDSYDSKITKKKKTKKSSHSPQSIYFLIIQQCSQT